MRRTTKAHREMPHAQLVRAEDDVRGVIWPERHRDYLSDTPLATRSWNQGDPVEPGAIFTKQDLDRVVTSR